MHLMAEVLRLGLMQANLATMGTKKAMVQRLMERELLAGASESSSAGEQRDTASRSSSATMLQHGAHLTGLGQTQACH